MKIKGTAPLCGKGNLQQTEGGQFQIETAGIAELIFILSHSHCVSLRMNSWYVLKYVRC